MLAFIARRLGAGIVLAWVVVTGMFFFLKFTGADPARGALGLYATEDQVATKREQLGLDRPVLEQYWDWLSHALQGDLGMSSAQNTPVIELLVTRLPVTVSLAVGATLVAAIIGTLLGMLAAVKPGRFDRGLQVVMVLGFALPNFWVAIILALIFAVKLRWLPATGYIHITNDPIGWLSTVTLPIIALSIGSIAAIAQQLRNSVISVSSQDYVRTLRSRGLSSLRILLTNVLRNAAMGGAAIVERVFALQGIGSVAINASGNSDIQVIMGVLLFTVLLVVLVNLIVDIAYSALNPKVRVS